MLNPLRWLYPLICLVATASAFESGPSYRALERAAGRSLSGTSSEALAEGARRDFDEPIDPSIFEPKNATKAATPPQSSRLHPAGDFVVGRPQNLGEPRNPLTKEGKPKGKIPKWFGRVLGGLLGGFMAGALGFFLGGPVGAAFGFAAGAIGGWMVVN